MMNLKTCVSHGITRCIFVGLVGLLMCCGGNDNTEAPLTLAECKDSNWISDSNSIGTTQIGRQCDSLLFVDFANDCKWETDDYGKRFEQEVRRWWGDGFPHFLALKRLSPKIGGIHWIQRVRIEASNSLKELPKELWSLPYLYELKIYDIDSVAQFPEIASCPSLEYLTILSYTSDSLPSSWQQCSKLESITIHSSGITHLPDWLVNLPNLEGLDLSYNKIDTLPQWLPQMPSLAHLDLSYNQIRTLPENIGELSDQASLNFSDNRLRQLPASFCAFSPISYDINNNPFCDLPDSISSCLQKGYQIVTPCPEENL